MRSPKRKSLSWILISAAVLLGTNGAYAAEFAVDAQMQARDLLSGTAGGRGSAASVSRSAPAHGGHEIVGNPQEQARQLVLGKPNGAGITHRAIGIDLKMTTVREPHRVEADAQELARRMVLGVRWPSTR